MTEVLAPKDYTVCFKMRFQQPSCALIRRDCKKAWAVGNLTAYYPKDATHGVGCLRGIALQAFDPTSNVADAYTDMFKLVI